MPFRAPDPESGVSTNFTTWARWSHRTARRLASLHPPIQLDRVAEVGEELRDRGADAVPVRDERRAHRVAHECEAGGAQARGEGLDHELLVVRIEAQAVDARV